VKPPPSDEVAEYLRALATCLTKSGIPVQLRADADHRPYVRASHPEMPVSTDVYCVRDEGGSCFFHSEWGRPIAPADDPAMAIGYVLRLLRTHLR
jgi:hypothetical protein